MNQLIVKQEASDIGIVNAVGCVIQGVNIQKQASELDDTVDTLESQIKDNMDEIINRPEVAGFRDLFSGIGYPDQTPAGEHLVRLIKERGLNRHNNVVDAYNIASAESGSGLGMHDVSHISGDVIVARANGDEHIHPLFGSDQVTAQSGDLLYHIDDYVLALLGHIDADSDEFKITEKTNEVLLLALGNKETSEEYNREICKRTYDLVAKTCPAATIEFLDTVYKT